MNANVSAAGRGPDMPQKPRAPAKISSAKWVVAALSLLSVIPLAGPPSEFLRALLMGAAWVINLAVAEWIIRRRPALPAHTASAVVSHLP